MNLYIQIRTCYEYFGKKVFICSVNGFDKKNKKIPWYLPKIRLKMVTVKMLTVPIYYVEILKLCLELLLVLLKKLFKIQYIHHYKLV